MHFVFVAAWIAGFSVANSCYAIFANIGKEVPIERLIENIGRYVSENPAEAHGYYLLGRVHSMAFAKQAEVVRVVEPDWSKPLDHHENDFKFSPYDRVQAERKDSLEGQKLPPAVRDHLLQSIDNYRMAVALDTRAPVEEEKFYDQRFYRLGLAWMLEMGAPWAGQLGMPPVVVDELLESDVGRGEIRQLLEQLAQTEGDERAEVMRNVQSVLPVGASVVEKAATDQDERPPVQAAASAALARCWQETALKVYRDAYAYALPDDLDAESMYAGNEREKIVSFEAAKGIERLLQARDGLADAEQAELAEIRKNIEHFKALPQWITPIVVGTQADASLDDLLDKRRTAAFDLDGTGRGHRWPWVRPKTGILVWDPDETGRITSGRQLFGSVTWWLFWDNGYDALAALDDDGDGALTANELAGIAIWRDRNSDGASDPSEVRSVKRAGIVRISVKGHIGAGGVLSNSNGVEFDDGDVLPTFDWTPTSRP